MRAFTVYDVHKEFPNIKVRLLRDFFIRELYKRTLKRVWLGRLSAGKIRTRELLSIDSDRDRLIKTPIYYFKENDLYNYFADKLKVDKDSSVGVRNATTRRIRHFPYKTFLKLHEKYSPGTESRSRKRYKMEKVMAGGGRQEL
jgi:hypothetical protein